MAMNIETPVKTPTAVQSEHVDSSFLSTNQHMSSRRSVTLILNRVTDRKVRTASGFCVNANVHNDSIQGGHFLEQVTY